MLNLQDANNRSDEIFIVILTDVVVECFPLTITPCVFTLIFGDGVIEISIRRKYLVDMIFVYALNHTKIICLYRGML